MMEVASATSIMARDMDENMPRRRACPLTRGHVSGPVPVRGRLDFFDVMASNDAQAGGHGPATRP
jgi:hypothetical protein